MYGNVLVSKGKDGELERALESSPKRLVTRHNQGEGEEVNSLKLSSKQALSRVLAN